MWIDDFVHLLEQSTVENPTVEAATKIKQSNMPKRIYKYREDNANARNCLTAGTIWLSSPLAYNDPYDCAIKIVDETIIGAFERNLFDRFVEKYQLEDVLTPLGIATARGGPTPLKTLIELTKQSGSPILRGHPDMMADFVLNHALPEYVANTKSFFRQAQSSTKLCSFSEINDSILMWSHYSKNHTGFCIEYDVESLPINNVFRQNLHPVVYASELYDFTRFLTLFVNASREKIKPMFPLLGVLHKFLEWSYEKEWRLVFFPNAIVPDQLHPAPIPSAVFLGSKMQEIKQREMAAICKSLNIPLHQMQLKGDSFQLSPESYLD